MNCTITPLNLKAIQCKRVLRNATHFRIYDTNLIIVLLPSKFHVGRYGGVKA